MSLLRCKYPIWKHIPYSIVPEKGLRSFIKGREVNPFRHLEASVLPTGVSSLCVYIAPLSAQTPPRTEHVSSLIFGLNDLFLCFKFSTLCLKKHLYSSFAFSKYFCRI